VHLRGRALEQAAAAGEEERVTGERPGDSLPRGSSTTYVTAPSVCPGTWRAVTFKEPSSNTSAVVERVREAGDALVVGAVAVDDRLRVRGEDVLVAADVIAVVVRREDRHQRQPDAGQRREDGAGSQASTTATTFVRSSMTR